MGILLILIEKYPNILEGKEEANNLKISIHLFGILVQCLIIYLAVNPFFFSYYFWQALSLTYLLYLICLYNCLVV